MTAIYVLSVLLACSIAISITLYLRLKNHVKRPSPTLDAKDLIHDITKHGSALVRIHVLDPEGLFISKAGR